MPANNPTTIAAPIVKGNSHHACHGKLSDLADKVLNQGRNTQANTNPNKNDNKLKRKDSVKNCLTRFKRKEPTTFLNPTSFARFADLAMDRLIKLMQTILNIKTAMAPNNQSNFISPCDKPSSSFVVCK